MALDLSGLSTDPNVNTSIGGINVAEQCPSENINDAIRWLAAAIATLKAAGVDTSAFMSKGGGVFTGNPTYQGQGGYLHNVSQVGGGAVSYLPGGSALPASGQDGDMVIFYS
jgi:hypothetical protein